MLRIPVATLRNWEQNRFVMEPAAQTLLKLIDREPESALRALRGPRPPDPADESPRPTYIDTQRRHHDAKRTSDDRSDLHRL